MVSGGNGAAIDPFDGIHPMDCIPAGRSSLAAITAGCSLFVFGGYNGQEVLNDFFEFKFEPVSIPPSSFLLDMRGLVNN